MHRRRFLGGLAGSVTVPMAGCSGNVESSANSDSTAGNSATATSTPDPLGTTDNPWLGFIAHLSGDGQSPVEEVFESTIRRILIGDNIWSVYVEGESVQSVAEQAQNSPYTLEAMASVDWRDGSVCKISCRVRIPKEPAESEVKSTFPNAVSVSESASPGGDRFWVILGRLQSSDEVERRLNELDVDLDAATVYLYDECKRVA